MADADVDWWRWCCRWCCRDKTVFMADGPASMTLDFQRCLRFVLQKEGGFVDHPADRGGATNRGITQGTYDDWRKRRGLLPQSVRLLTDDEVAAIYRRDYWDKVRADELPAPVNLVVFDDAVNSGVNRAARRLQKACKVATDGAIGPRTIAAAKLISDASGALNLALDIIEQRVDFYHNIVETNPSQSVFLRGWLNRMNDLERECRKWA